ncbi:MAG TPA: outer membrane beta-barrel protein [Bacteroidales bacterium]|nr:outer membrane beta-barrel protein [Bacteroidales bacterium]
MKRFFFILFPILLFTLSAPAQDSYLKKRWNIKLGYSTYTSMFLNIKPVNNNNYRLELNYGVLNNIETGVYAGYSKMLVSIPGRTTGLIESSSPVTFFYGVNFNYHLLPLVIKEDNFRFDLYLTGKAGGMNIEHNYLNQFEYSLGGGAALYLFKHFGGFVEYTYGKYYYKDQTKLRYGLSVKF